LTCSWCVFIIRAQNGTHTAKQNNAAIAIDHDFSESVGRTIPALSTRKLLATTYDTNVFGTATLITALMPLLERSSAFRIVNVTSGLGSLSMMVDPTNSFSSAQILVGTFSARISAYGLIM
jgi:short-subunit dehydrogenase involved in D-alanine esterification of teichoic acids